MAKKRSKRTQTKDRVVNLVIPSTCPKCGSTEREPYLGNPIVKFQSGVFNGFEYNQITWKRTQCKTCGQYRQDRIFEKK